MGVRAATLQHRSCGCAGSAKTRRPSIRSPGHPGRCAAAQQASPCPAVPRRCRGGAAAAAVPLSEPQAPVPFRRRAHWHTGVICKPPCSVAGAGATSGAGALQGWRRQSLRLANTDGGSGQVERARLHGLSESARRLQATRALLLMQRSQWARKQSTSPSHCPDQGLIAARPWKRCERDIRLQSRRLLALGAPPWPLRPACR